MITRGVYFLAEKSEVFQKFMAFRSLVENETSKVKAKKTMFEDRVWRGIHITGVGAYLKSTGFADSLRALILHSRTESRRGRIDILAKPQMNAKNVQPGRMHDD